MYLDIAAFQNFKVSLLLPNACLDFARDRKVIKFCEFEFRLNCNQHSMFHQGTNTFVCKYCSVLFVTVKIQ